MCDSPADRTAPRRPKRPRPKGNRAGARARGRFGSRSRLTRSHPAHPPPTWPKNGYRAAQPCGCERWRARCREERL
eukprot:4793117-Prymnesium_polylepis.1